MVIPIINPACLIVKYFYAGIDGLSRTESSLVELVDLLNFPFYPLILTAFVENQTLAMYKG
jgi:hypothetical protein